MKISELIDSWEPGEWPELKVILKALAGEEEIKVPVVPTDEV